MRRLIVMAAAVAGLALAGCGDTVSQAEATPPPAKKSLARMAPLYAGQEQVQSIQTAKVEVAEGGGLDLEAKAMTDGAGWTDVGFLPRVYAATPPDGVYEIDVVAQKPTGPGAAGPTPVEVKSAWDKYKDGRVKGVKFIAKTNEVTVMVPAPATAAGK